jgi:4'-phosphopantetheinyl transferase EntD
MIDAVYAPAPTPYALLRSEPRPFGHLCAVALPQAPFEVPAAALAALQGGEVAHALTLGGPRRAEWVGGRHALRHAAAALGVALGEVLPGPRGQPTLPDGLTASISHKRGLALALVAPRAAGFIGVDLEELLPERLGVARHVLRPEELLGWEQLPEADRWPELRDRFTAKEALYKALHPVLNRFVGFDEAALTRRPDGGFDVAWHLKSAERVQVTEVRVTREAPWVRAEVRLQFASPAVGRASFGDATDVDPS